jgi:hypothetical protein
VRSVGRFIQVLRLSSGTFMPCVTSNSCALKAADSSLPRNTQVAAMSAGTGKSRCGAPPSKGRASVIRPKNSLAVAPASAPFSLSIVANTLRMRSLRIGPGKIMFTRTPRSPSSSATFFDSAFSAAFGTT